MCCMVCLCLSSNTRYRLDGSEKVSDDMTSPYDIFAFALSGEES